MDEKITDLFQQWLVAFEAVQVASSRCKAQDAPAINRLAETG
jgi:hypothetical protein